MVTLDGVKNCILSLSPFPDEIEGIGIEGSLVQGSFSAYSDIDIFVILDKYDFEKEIFWTDRLKNALSEYHRDVNVFVYDINSLKKIINWYVFEMASDSILVYDKGKVKKIFNRILQKTEEWELVREKFGRHWCWMLGRPAKPGEKLKFELED